MSSNYLRIALVAAAAWVAAPAAADAQIYSWRDAAGNLVLSDRPQDAGAKTFAVRAVGYSVNAPKPAEATTTDPVAPTTFRTTRAANVRRSQVYEPLIVEHAAAHNISADLVRAVIQAESAFDPFARSHKGAMGLMQLMPATARAYNVLNAYDPAQNIRAGVAYLKSLLVRYSHNVELALAAYNAGPGAVEKYGAVPPYRETRDYVKKIRNHARAAALSSTMVYKTTRVSEDGGKKTFSYSNKPSAGAAVVTTYGTRDQ
jgi:soluble lytic murein transglycosylase-like protein